MKNRKPFLCFLLALVLPLAMLAGCGEKSASGAAFAHSEGLDENGFWAGVKALDYVGMFDYQAMRIPNDVHHISDDDLQAEIDALLADYSSARQVTDRAAADGDTVNIDYVGSIGGVAFEGGSTEGEGTDVTIGVTSYIDDFLEQLIGHTPGETINVEVTFPDDYHEATLQGKDAVFVTTINYIVEYAEAELTDDFVAENLSLDYGWATVAEMKEGMRSEMQKNAIYQYIQQFFTTEVAVASVPDHLLEYQEGALLNSYREYAEYYGMELNALLSEEGFASEGELIEASQDSNREGAVYYLVIQAVAEDAGISVSDEDLTAYFTEYVGTSDYSSYEEQYGLPYLKQVVLSQMVLDYIMDRAILL